MGNVSKATSADGTDIAFERSGDGPPVIVVDGALCDRAANRPLAEELAKRFTVINYDRRGRGDSGDTAPYAPEREIEDLEAIIAEAGGSASVYGHSSGAALALRAAARGLPIARLVLHEPPYTLEDEDLKRASREEAETIETLLAEGRRGDALRLFLTGTGMPPEMVDRMSGDPGTVAMAPTLAYDFAVLGYASGGGTIPEDLAPSAARPTLVIHGTTSPAFIHDTAARIASLLPNGRHAVLEGQDHFVPPEVLAPVLEKFFVESAEDSEARGKEEE